MNDGDKMDVSEKIGKFVNREIKARKIFEIVSITKKSAYNFVKDNHYLKDAKFFSEKQYGLYIGDSLVGVSTYSRPQGNVALKGWFGLSNQDDSVLELSRLAVISELNGSNATSYLLRGSIKKLSKTGVRAVITLADSSRHVGSIYQVCGFRYFGLTDKKKDFYRFDGKKNPRGSTKSVRGVWVDRTQKHRYAVILDENLICNYDEKEYPKQGGTEEVTCCLGTGKIKDNRFNEEWDCPICKKTDEHIENHATQIDIFDLLEGE